MGTTIDNIQIEIQSSSTNAAKGITDLSKALGELKKNGSFGTATKNLEKLSNSLNGLNEAYRASNSLRNLANSIEKLKSVGSISSLTNSLAKLPNAFKSLGSIDFDGLKPKIDGLVSALSPLTQLKGSGFASMVNSMAKIEKVTKSLDETKIGAFKAKIQELDAAIGPFATKMGTIQSALKGIDSTIKHTTVSIERANAEVNVSVFNFSNLINVFNAVKDAMTAVIQKFSNLIHSAIEWDGVAARFGRGFEAQAQSTYAWIQKLNDELHINIQQFMQHSSVYATMLTGFGVASKDASKMALGYMELTYDIWAGYNDIYGSLEEAAEAVRSAIAGEVEPVRRAGFTIIESTLQQTAANHGLAISLETATEAQKSYLRYLTLVDQAHAQGLVGTYAKEMNTAEGLLRTVNQQIKSLTQALGSLFMPILVKVLPYVQAFVELLTDGVQALAAMFGITIQGVDWSDYNAGASNALENTQGVTDALNGASQAAKELKNATLGLDELNVISPSTSSSGGGGGAGSGSGGTGFEGVDIDSLWDDSIFKDINDQVDALKEKFKDWLPLIATIGAGLSAWGLASLISSAGEAMVKLSEMKGFLGGLKKTLASLAILTIEAVLVFKLSDEYLESGNLMSLFGEALATAAGGYLMYKGFGAKGLVMSLAVSMAAQLTAITLNLADGGVEMDDPQLWIQSAFTTALGGTAGGFLAYKGIIKMSTGKGVGLGLLAGLSLTLASITIGDVAANGEATTASIFTGIGSVLAAAGFGLMIGGPWGAAIGALVGLTINIAGAAIGAVSNKAEKSIKEDLESRFGNIELSGEMLSVYIDKITAIPRKVTINKSVWNEELEKAEIQEMTVAVSAALDVFADENKTLSGIKNTLESIQGKIDTQNIKISLGMEVKPEDYAANIDAFVTNAQNYLDQYYLTTNVAIEILGGDSSLSGTLASFYTTNSAKLAELGADLKKVVSDAFVDGEWIPDKLNEALEIQKEIQDILDYVADVEFRAKIQNLKLSISGDALTPESFTNVLSGAKEAIESRLAALEEVKMSNLQVAIMEYDANIDAGMSKAEAKKIYNQTVADIETEYQNGRVEITYGTVDFGLETLQDAFKKEIAEIESAGGFSYELQLDRVFSMPGGENYTLEVGKYLDLTKLQNELAAQFEADMDKLPSAARGSLEKLLEALKPTMADFEEIAAENRKAGTTVSQSISQGLNDLKELEALSGSADAVKYLIGKGFSGDSTFLNTLATAKNAGKAIDKNVAEGLLNNITYVTDEATGVVTGIKNSITGEVIAVTPTLKDNMAQLGVNLSTGVLNGAESEMQKEKKSWKDWAIWPWNWFKETNEINSPSKLFERGGKHLTDGLVQGVEQNSLSDKLSSVWSTAKTWWNEKKGNLSTYTPSIGNISTKLSTAWTDAKNWWNEKRSSLSYTPSIGKIWEKLKSAWTSAKDWWNKSRSNLSYTPTIGSISSKLSSAWTTAKNWWNKSRSSLSYTPSIGSIKDKVISAWNSAKSWWNKNVKLSTKLDIKVPKIKVNWDTASAFGKSFKYPTGFKLEFAKDGGVFDAGSLIWAGEHGAEIVANAAGGKTGVMNVQQMEDAVYEGVYAAFTAVMRNYGGNGGAQSVNVYLDGRQITSVVEKRQQERGASIMGNEVYSY